MWKTEARKHVILAPFVSTKHPIRGEADSLILSSSIEQKIDQEALGLWPLVYNQRESVWIENMNRTLAEGFIVNKNTGNKIEGPKHLEFYKDTQSIIIVPVYFRKIVWGIYSIEFDKPSEYKKEILDQIETIASCLANIVWKSEVLQQNCTDTDMAVTRFKQSVIKLEDQVIGFSEPTCFYIRPFGEKFQTIETCMQGMFDKKGIRLRHYEHTPGSSIVIENIMNQIRMSHCGIADITENHENVMLELGMLMASQKEFILIKQHEDYSGKKDGVTLPFDLRSYNYYEYKLDKEQKLLFKYPADNKFKPCDSVLEKFCDCIIKHF